MHYKEVKVGRTVIYQSYNRGRDTALGIVSDCRDGSVYIHLDCAGGTKALWVSAEQLKYPPSSGDVMSDPCDALKLENKKLNVQLHYYKTVSYSLHRHVTQLRLECQALKQGWVDLYEATDYEKTTAFLDSLGISYKIDDGTKGMPGNTVMFDLRDDEVTFSFNIDNSLHEIFTHGDDW